MTAPFPYLVKQNPETLSWHVERIHEDGEIEWTIFLGKDAEARARDYAALKNRGGLHRVER